MISTPALNVSAEKTSVRLRLIGFAVALAIAAMTAIWGTGVNLDEQIRLLRDKARSSQASGTIAIVEIDARSLKAISDWPWPRRTHAALIDRLREAGADTIAFDVDFSATSDPVDDRALADALARADGAVILPTFRQPISDGSNRFSENLPIAPLRAHAFLGSVNVHPDADGRLRSYSYGTITAGIPRPSIAALLVNSRSNIGQSFRVDTAIDPATIPRVSAIDVLNGNTSVVKGRSIIVGATAIEMGDRYVVPGEGILPGVVLQALAAETLIRGTMNPDWGTWPTLFIAGAALLFGVRTRRYQSSVTGALAVVVVTPFFLELVHVGTLQIVPSLILVALDMALVGLLGIRHRLEESRLIDAVTDMPNAVALERHCRQLPDVAITVVRLPQFDEIAAVLSAEDRTLMMTQVVNRLSVAFPHSLVHSIEAGVVAWPSNAPTESDQADAAAALFRAPITLTNRAVLVSPVFGVSHGPGFDAEHLLARANIAARQAQASGKRWTFESSTLSSDADRSIALIADIETAIANKEIYVVYQAKWDVAKARICGAEALVRWHHPAFGPLSPDEFIPVLENNGQMRTLTLAVVDICIAQLRNWRTRSHDLTIAINISAALLDDHEFVDDITQRLGLLGSGASAITLELTESATITSTQTAVAALTAFRSFGARVSIDDYGTGQATLNYLKSFPADEIKIDKSFVTNMLDSNSDMIVVRSTIELAHQLGFTVVAEGVEDAQCLDRLREYGCDLIQGWVIGKPIKADAFIESVRLQRISLAA